MVKITVYLDDEDVRSLRAMYKRTAKPQVQLIREAVRTLIATHRPPLPGGLGMFDTGRTDTATRRKEIMREAALNGTWRS